MLRGTTIQTPRGLLAVIDGPDSPRCTGNVVVCFVRPDWSHDSVSRELRNLADRIDREAQVQRLAERRRARKAVTHSF